MSVGRGIRNLLRVFSYRLRVKASRLRVDLVLALRGNVLLTPIEIAGAVRQIERLNLGERLGAQRDITVYLTPNTQGRLIVGQDVFIGKGCFFSICADMTIGDNVLIGPYSYLASATHVTIDANVPMAKQGLTGEPLTIGEDVWIGTGVTIMPGIEIGRGSIIGAGSVVTKSIPPSEVWAGVPARKLRARK